MSDEKTRRPPCMIIGPNDVQDLVGATISGLNTTAKGSTITLQLKDGTMGKLRLVSNEDALPVRPPKKERKQRDPREPKPCRYGTDCNQQDNEEHLKKFTHESK